MGGLDEEEPPSKRIKPSSLQFCTNSNFFPQTHNLPLSTKPPNPSLEFGASMARPVPHPQALIGSKGFIKRDEFVRIITKALYSLGYERSGSILEEESGIQLHEPVIDLFRKQVLNGDWDGSIQTLHKIGLEQNIVKSAAFVILEHKFFELLENGNILDALKTLQAEISPLEVKKERVHALTGCILCPARFAELGFLGENCRVRVLEELQNIFPPSIMVPERRLEQLVEQALNVQKDACYFHNFKGKTLSLYMDHRCGKEQIPSRTTQVLDAHQDEVWYIQFSNNGKYLASASHDTTAIIWEVNADGQLSVKHKLTGHTQPVLMVSWSPDDQQILTCGMEESVRLWDTCSGRCLRVYEKAGLGLTSCGFFPNGKDIITGISDKSFSVWGPDGREIDSFKCQQQTKTSDLAITCDGRLIVSLNKEKVILLADRETKRERVIEEQECVTSFSLSSDGKFLLVNVFSGQIHLWFIGNDGLPSLIMRYKGHRRARYVIRSCFGGTEQAFIASGSEDSLVYIWHRATGDLIETLAGHSGTVNCVSWNPTNPYMLASASDDHTVRIWGLNKPNIHKRKDLSENGSCSNGVHQCNGNSK
ncbi:WD repeat-containing protein 26 [Rhynchospora pubera]|uniref:WD repeat-containing protein 26 n=1 Tax=Rhynchospora pubera TaxID=906938 RepID=A0AAV8DZ54_9POAL|nr:WD repeat-containing protein 26 [Rhynchospora pubera]